MPQFTHSAEFNQVSYRNYILYISNTVSKCLQIKHKYVRGCVTYTQLSLGKWTNQYYHSNTKQNYFKNLASFAILSEGTYFTLII